MSTEDSYTDGSYLAKNPTWHAEHSQEKAVQVVKLLSRNGIVPSTVGEIGCGAGGILDCLAQEYGTRVEFTGFEISPQAFELCATRKRQNLRFFLGDMFADEADPFDVVMAIDVFEHVEDYLGFLRKLRHKGVHKVFHIPLSLSAQTVWRMSPILRDREMAGHIHDFTKDTALASLRDTGYEIVDYFYEKESVGLPNCGWKAGLLELPRTLLFPIHQDLTARVLGGFSLWVLAT